MAASEDDTNEDSGVATAQPAQATNALQGGFNVPQAIIQGLGQRGVTANNAYGVIGSFMGESGKGLNSNSINRGDGSDGSDSIGFGQWNGVRAQNLRATAALMGLQPSDPRVQVAHYFNELDGKYKSGNYGQVLSALQNSDGSVAAGNDIHTRQYEVPANASAQVANRLGYGNAVAAAAANGQLDKFGSITPGSQNTFDPRSMQANAGALGANNVAGGNSGALYADDAPAPMSVGERMTRFGAALAGISNPGQASAMLAGIPKTATPTSKVDQAIKQAQLQAYLKKAQTPDALKDLGATPDGNGRLMQNPTTGAVTVAPVQGIDKFQDNSAPVPKSADITNFGKQVGFASQNAQALDSLYKLRDQAINDPNIMKSLDGTSSMSSYMNNFLGQSNDMSRFQKDLAAASNSYVTNLQATMPGSRSTNDLRKMEMNSIMPVGAQNDSRTVVDSIQRMIDKTQNNYGTNVGNVNQLQGIFKDNLKFSDPSTGKPMSTDDYDKSNRGRWDAIDKTSQAGMAAFLAAHAARSNGGVAPVSRTQQILQHFGVQ